MNQVYFYRLLRLGQPAPAQGLNPFMNQVYFYREPRTTNKGEVKWVLIPLWIRSISTRSCWKPLLMIGICVLIPLWIRSISTLHLRKLLDESSALCLNPFMNQVYFYVWCSGWSEGGVKCLNPFMNQVYFYDHADAERGQHDGRLNPFMNQVYFYKRLLNSFNVKKLTVLIPLWIRSISTYEACVYHESYAEYCLNPFMNQVYFYSKRPRPLGPKPTLVLIPLWIRSISTTAFWCSTRKRRLLS